MDRSVTFHGFTDCRELVYCLPDVVLLNPGEVVIYPNQKAPSLAVDQLMTLEMFRDV